MHEWGKRAAKFATALREAGYEVEEKHYPAGLGDDLNRYYVLPKDLDGKNIDCQFNEKLPFGNVNTYSEDENRARKIAEVQAILAQVNKE